jgi:hypothetical protein
MSGDPASLSHLLHLFAWYPFIPRKPAIDVLRRDHPFCHSTRKAFTFLCCGARNALGARFIGDITNPNSGDVPNEYYKPEEQDEQAETTPQPNPRPSMQIRRPPVWMSTKAIEYVPAKSISIRDAAH